MERRKFSREFKIEAVKLVRERGVGPEPAFLAATAPICRSWTPMGQLPSTAGRQGR